jgi:parallel beta-helix repeat protein
MRAIAILAIAIFLLVTMPKVITAQRYLSISDDRSGGDCASPQGIGQPIGKWDSITKTCTLLRDVQATIQIKDNDITLDGAGFSLKPGNSSDYGVFLSNVNGAQVKNLKIERFSIGIYSDYSSDSQLNGNTITNNSNWGIYLFSSRNNLIGKNNITGNGTGGIEMISQSDDMVVSNTLSDNGAYGIYLGTSDSNTIRYNSLSYHTWGLTLWAHSNDNLIVHNIFQSNKNGPIFNELGNDGNLFNLPAPVGGNYYGDYDTPAEGCKSDWGQKFCNTPYTFPTGQDNLPWIARNGWQARNSYCSEGWEAIITYLLAHSSTPYCTQKGVP